jgi:hypothetical protein
MFLASSNVCSVVETGDHYLSVSLTWNIIRIKYYSCVLVSHLKMLTLTSLGTFATQHFKSIPLNCTVSVCN